MLALILARGGSKRLPGKNIKPLLGKPLIQHTLEHAVQSQRITRILVSTDCPDIRAVALSVKGVEAPFLRPEALAADTTQAYDVHMHALEWLEQHEGSAPGDFCLLLPTSPLRLPSDIDGSIALYERANADVVTSVYQTKPLGWHLKMDPSSKKMLPLMNIDRKEAVKNYQEQEAPPYILNGSVYVLKTSVYRESRTYFGEKTYGFEMPLSRSMDIDTQDDFDLAEAIMKARSGP